MDEINESNNQPTSLAPSLIETKDQISTINHHHSSSSNTQESFIINQDKTREEQPRLKVVMEQVVDKYLETAPSNRSDNLINSMQYHQDQRNSLTNHLQTIDPTRKLMDLEPKEQQQKTHSNTIAHSDHQVTYSFKPQKKQAVKKEQPQRVPCYALSIGGVICVLRVDYFALLPISIPTPALFYYSLSKTHTFDECSGVDPSLASNIDTDLKIFTFYINTLTQFIQHPIQFNLKSKQTHILIMREEIRVYPLSIMTKKGQRVFKNHDEVVNVRQAVIDKMILKKEIVMKELNEMKMLLDGELDEWMYREKDATCGIFISISMARLKDRDPQSVQINSLTSSPITTTPSTSITTSPIIQSIQDRKWFERGKWSCQDINMSKSDILNKADQKNNSTKTNIDRTPFQPCLSQRNMTQSFGYLGVGESMADINFDLNKGNSMTSLDFNSSTNNGSCSGCVIGDGNGMSSNGNSGDCDGAGCNSNSNGGNSIGNGSELVKPKGIPLLKVGTKKMSVGRGLTISQDVFRVRVWMKQSNTFEYNMV